MTKPLKRTHSHVRTEIAKLYDGADAEASHKITTTLLAPENGYFFRTHPEIIEEMLSSLSHHTREVGALIAATFLGEDAISLIEKSCLEGQMKIQPLALAGMQEILDELKVTAGKKGGLGNSRPSITVRRA